ncbi:WGR domain-containing protein [Loktanella sp. DJP18]|uniref:WGR domain-containing protein n=1 Tax=Loktanella sp. DJP18 TaxID=3409788 RepID=UPI003BB5B2CB
MQTYLEKRDAATNQARYYRMLVLANLFRAWTLYREWGRIGQGGKVRMDWFDSEDLAVGALLVLEAAKSGRGYWVEPQQLQMFRE